MYQDEYPLQQATQPSPIKQAEGDIRGLTSVIQKCADRVAFAHSNVAALADRLYGEVPEGKTGEEIVPATGAISEAYGAVEWLNKNISALEAEIGRLSRLA